MNSDTDWIKQEEVSKEAYAHYMQTDPNMREMLGPIETRDDPVTGRIMRVRKAGIAMMRGAKELKEMDVWLDPIPHVRMAKGADLRGWYSAKGDGALRGQRERPCMTDAVLTSPYSGTCEIQCGFCYINSGFRGYRGAGLTAVPMEYGEHVRKQLSTMKSSAAGYFTSFHEPFNSLEDFYHNTQSGAGAFVDAGLPIFFLSRRKYPSWALDMLTRNKYSYMQKSLNTPHEDDWRKLSPGAATLEEHFEDIREAKRRGIYVSIQVNPIIPGIVTHEDIERLIDLLAEAGADHAIFKYVEANHPWAGAMVERVTKRFGDNRSAAFRDLFTENCSGGQKTVTEEYRREGHTRSLKRTKERGLTMSLCYEYTKKSGEWRSMGPEFLTSDQCHGHRVPFFSRQLLSEPFREVEVCPPSGCLSCSSDNGGKPKCGSELFGAAKALKLTDYKQPVF